MNSLLRTLLQKKKRTLTILLGYFFFVVTTHELVGELVARVLYANFDRSVYELIIMSISSIILALILVSFSKNLNKLAVFPKVRAWTYVLLWLVIVGYSLHIIFVVNVELIHYPQYALAAILVFCLTGNYLSSLLFATLLGIIDEAYQYFILLADTSNYLDLNDMFINMIGAVGGLIYLRSLGFIDQIDRPSIWKMPAFWLFILLFIAVLIGIVSGLVSFEYMEGESPALIQLTKIQLDHFWTELPNGTVYHVICASEFLILFIAVLLIFRNLGR